MEHKVVKKTEVKVEEAKSKKDREDRRCPQRQS